MTGTDGDPDRLGELLTDVLQDSARWGFLGPGPVEDHLIHAQGFAQALHKATHGQNVKLLDLGSGGGIPGLPLFCWDSALSGVLLDIRKRRTEFLTEALDRLGISDRVAVVTARAEEALRDPSLGLAEAFDAVVARSFGPPSATLELAAQFCAIGGRSLISEPPGGRTWGAQGLHRVGMQLESQFGDSIAVFRKIAPSPPLRSWKALVSRPVIDVLGTR